MKKSRTLLKLAALTSSVLLLAGYVSFRAGAFDRETASIRPAAPAATPEVDPHSQETDTAAIPKSAVGASQPKIEKTAPMFLPGSKSIGVNP